MNEKISYLELLERISNEVNKDCEIRQSSDFDKMIDDFFVILILVFIIFLLLLPIIIFS